MILDVGCGSSKRGDIGIDIYRREGVDVVADAHFLPFVSECFDEVFSVNLLEHLHSVGFALREQKRVLKKGGRIWAVADAPYWKWLIHIKGVEHADFFKKGEETHDRHYMLFTIEHLRNLFADAGLTITKMEPEYRGDGYKRLKWLDYILQRLPWLRHIAYPRISVVGVKE